MGSVTKKRKNHYDLLLSTFLIVRTATLDQEYNDFFNVNFFDHGSANYATMFFNHISKEEEVNSTLHNPPSPGSGLDEHVHG